MMELNELREARCEDFLADLSAYIDGELSLARAEEVKKHIDNCTSCKEIYESLLRISGDIGALGTDVPKDLHLQIMNAVNEAADKKSNNKKSFYSKVQKIGLWCGAGIAAVLCIAVVGGPFMRSSLDAKGENDALNNMGADAENYYVAHDISDYGPKSAECYSKEMRDEEYAAIIESADYASFVKPPMDDVEEESICNIQSAEKILEQKAEAENSDDLSRGNFDWDSDPLGMLKIIDDTSELPNFYNVFTLNRGRLEKNPIKRD